MSHISKGDVHAYLDGALGAYPEEVARHVREHLDTCRDCAQLLEGERRVRKEASAIIGTSALGPVELDPLEELLVRAAEFDGQQPAEGAGRADGSERGGRARPLLGSRLYAFRWAATVVISLGTGWMAREVTGPAGSVARIADTERVTTESVLRPVADQERLERDIVGGRVEEETEEAAPEAPASLGVVGGAISADRGVGFSDDATLEDPAAFDNSAALDKPVVLDQVTAVRSARQRAASEVAPEVVPADVDVAAQVAEPTVETARRSDELRAPRRSSSAPDADRQDGVSVSNNAATGSTASASLSTGSFMVPGLPVRDVRIVPEADGLAGGSGGLVIVTQELEDGRAIELRFRKLEGSDAVLREAFQERNELPGRTFRAGWVTVDRVVPGGVAVLSGPLTALELEDLLDRVFGAR